MKRKLCFTLAAFLAMTLALAVSSGSASDGSAQALMNGQNFETMTACQGGILPVTMVSGSTNLQISPSEIADVNTQAAQDTSSLPPLAGSSAQLVTDQPLAGVASSGGNSFHTGKIIVASTPIEAAGMMRASAAV